MLKLEIDFTDIGDCESEIEMLGNNVATSCFNLAESSKTKTDHNQMKLRAEMKKGEDRDLTQANDYANKLKYFEHQQRKWVAMLRICENLGYKVVKTKKGAQKPLTAEELEALANAVDKK